MHSERETKKEAKEQPPVNLFIFGALSGRISKRGKSIVSQFCENCADQKNTLAYDGVGNSKSKNKALGAILGFFGNDENNMIKKAIEDIMKLKPSLINIMAFSNGAVEAIQLSAKLNQFLPDIKIRMLLIDPVACR